MSCFEFATLIGFADFKRVQAPGALCGGGAVGRCQRKLTMALAVSASQITGQWFSRLINN